MIKERMCLYIKPSIGLLLCLFLADCSTRENPRSRAQAANKSPKGNPTSSAKTAVQRIQELENLPVKVEGPNCWHANLYVAGLTDQIRYVAKGEYWFWMKSSFCARKADGDTLEAGDLGSLFYSSKGQYHSFTYQDAEKVFSKNSPDAKDPYKTQNYRDMFYDDFKDVADNCRGNQQNLKNNNCPLEVAFYKCKGLPADFYSQHEEFEKIDSELRPIEVRIRTFISDGQMNDALSKDADRLAEIMDSIRKRINDPSADKALVAKALVMRTLGDLVTITNKQEHLQSIRTLDDELKKAYAPAELRQLPEGK